MIQTTIILLPSIENENARYVSQQSSIFRHLEY